MGMKLPWYGYEITRVWVRNYPGMGMKLPWHGNNPLKLGRSIIIIIAAKDKMAGRIVWGRDPKGSLHVP